MSIVAKALINSKFAGTAITTEYTVPVGTRTIIDKFTVTNSSGSNESVTIYLVPSGSSALSSNMLIKARTINAAAIDDLTQLQNQILAAGDTIQVVSSNSSAIVIRASGREIT